MTRLFNKILICIIFFLVLGIVCKQDNKYRELIKYKLYEDNFSFSVFESYYNKYLGDIIPIEGLFNDDIKTVFNEDLVYNSSIPYYDGVMLEVGYNYLIPNIDKGVVVYIGKKDKYGNVVIVENGDGVNIWYGNVCNTNVGLYDHLNNGDLIGESCDNYLYLLYNKDNVFIDYEDFLR